MSSKGRLGPGEIIGIRIISGGIGKKYANHIINVPSSRTQTIQEVHILIGHCICEVLEESIKK